MLKIKNFKNYEFKFPMELYSQGEPTGKFVPIYISAKSEYQSYYSFEIKNEHNEVLGRIILQRTPDEYNTYVVGWATPKRISLINKAIVSHGTVSNKELWNEVVKTFCKVNIN